MKWLGLLVVLALVAGSWGVFVKTGERMGELEKRIEVLVEEGDPEERVGEYRTELQELDGRRTFNGILLAIFSAVLLGTVFVAFVLPAWVGGVTEAVYGSGERLEETAMHKGRALVGKGDYEAAIRAFRAAAEEEPENRMPWAEIAKVQRRFLDDPGAAVGTLEEAMSAREWSGDDMGFFLFRLAEIYHEDLEDKGRAVVTMQRVMREFPETRHAMNARLRLRDWGVV